MSVSLKALSPKQLTVLTWWTARSPYSQLDAIICDGAVRSGKTLSMSLSFFLWAARSFNGCRFGLCGKTISSLRRNVLSDLLPQLEAMGFGVEERRSENRISVSAGGRRNDFFIFGGRDESSAALIQGVTFAGVLLDEAALMPRSFVEQACARCSVAGSRLWFNCNPEGPNHWFYTDWILKSAEKRALHLHFTMDDNPALTPEIRRRYESLYSGVFHSRFVLGQWVAASGLIYDFFDGVSCPDAPDGPMERYYISCDYGTANPASFGLWGESRGAFYRLEEYYYDSRRAGRQLTDAEYADALEALAAGRPIEAVVVDPSAASFIELLSRRGLPVRRAVNDVLSGIRLTADLLRAGKLVICRGCRDLLREITLYCWDESAAGRDAVKKENDHAMDDMRYFAATIAGPRLDGEDFLVLSVERSGSRERGERGRF